ncbi:hypothetical protein DFJ74DRAFT_140672 [Hyaloraphidium curvatum]|nr:hypothetical protein DFJ74DRAFT_140672 [Hyaloraphidium curvatum]
MSNASGSPAGTPPSMGAEPELASQTSASHGTVPVTPQTHFSSLLWAINARGSAPATMGTVESNAVSSGPSGSVPRPAGMVQAAMGNSAAGAWSHVPLPRPNVRPVDYGPFAGPSSAAPSYGRPSFVQQGSTGLQAALGGPARPVVVPGQPRPAGQPAPGHMAGGQNAGAAAAANFQAAIQHRIDLSVSTATNAMKQVNARFQSNMVTKQQGHERRVLAAEAAVEALRRDLGECSSTITTMAGSIEKLQQALDSTTQRLADAERKLAGVEATSQASIRTVKSNAEAMAARIGTLEEAQRKMEGETQDLNGTVQAQAATISSLQAALNDSQNQFADMQFRCETLMNDLETLENRHDTLAHNHGALQARTEALETARAAGNDRMAGLQVRIDHLVAESEQNRAASTSATAQIDKLRVDVDDLAGRVESETEVRMLENHAIRSRIVDSSSQGAVASPWSERAAVEHTRLRRVPSTTAGMRLRATAAPWLLRIPQLLSWRPRIGPRRISFRWTWASVTESATTKRIWPAVRHRLSLCRKSPTWKPSSTPAAPPTAGNARPRGRLPVPRVARSAARAMTTPSTT